MIPRTLEEWSILAIEDLLNKGYYELEDFDFKEMLPRSKDEDGKKRLYKICCAFANSDGGFLVFGVKDDKSLPIADRLVGINPKDDFPDKFGNYPKNCQPSIQWNFKNPPLELQNGQQLHVVHIPRSWNAPHCVGNPEGGWLFAKRTNKGTEGMSYQEVRLMFLGYYEKRLKLQLLIAELENISGIAANSLSAPANTFVLQTFELTVIDLVLADTFTILAEKPELLTLLQGIRNTCRYANNIINIHLGIAANQQDIQNLGSHRETLSRAYNAVIDFCSKAIVLLREIVAK